MRRIEKFFIITIIVLTSFFSLPFVFNNKVLAVDQVVVNTNRFSVLSMDVFILQGSYFGNTQKKPLTTYFEYKRNDSNLDVVKDRQETIKIIRNTNVDESNIFYSSPELHVDSTYYFRAVGYFNDNPTQKFYGNVLSFRTGPIYVGSLYYNIIVDCSLDGQIRNIITNGCEMPVTCDKEHIRNIVTNQCEVAVKCEKGEVRDIITNACVTSASCDPKKSEVFNIITNKCDIVTPCTEKEVRNIITNKCEAVVECDGTNQVKNIITNKCETITPCEVNEVRDINTQKCVTRLTKLSTQEEGTPKKSATDSDSEITPPISGGLGVTCPKDKNGVDDCGFNDFITLINRVISFILFNLAIPISAIMFAYAGFLMLVPGRESANKRTKGNEIFWNVVWGLIIVAAAWLIVRTVLSILGYNGAWVGF